MFRPVFSKKGDCAPGGHLAVFGGIFDCHREGKGLLLASGRQRPGMLLIPTKHWTALQHRASGPNVNSAEGEKLKFRSIESTGHPSPWRLGMRDAG